MKEIVAIFTKDCCAEMSETFRIVSESFISHLADFVIFCNDFRLEMSVGAREYAGKSDIT